jgi:hypothetical protein
LFGDGSIFSYSVAVADGSRMHWHNIACRLFVHLFCHVPAETYVRLTADARGGVMIYGFLFFGAQLFGLLATFALDRSKQRILFSYVCGSTALLCPLVFGFPTEMWIAHALFWPTLAPSWLLPRARWWIRTPIISGSRVQPLRPIGDQARSAVVSPATGAPIRVPYIVGTDRLVLSANEVGTSSTALQSTARAPALVLMTLCRRNAERRTTEEASGCCPGVFPTFDFC